MSNIQNRYEFVYLFDVTNGNPNGDPDNGNQPRLSPDSSRGLVTDVCLKRKVRNFIQMIGGSGNRIFIQEKTPLNPIIAKAAAEEGLETFLKPKGGWDTSSAKGRSKEDVGKIQTRLCAEFYDVRAFGGVLSTGPNGGQIRGPVQFTFATSIEPVLPMEITITRVTDVDKEIGRASCRERVLVQV